MGNNLLSAKATLPVYDRNNLAPRIVHLGFGAFHRAHQGVYADILATEHFSDWGYYEVNLIGGEQQIADLHQQDNLYTVADLAHGFADFLQMLRHCTFYRIAITFLQGREYIKMLA